MAVDEVLRSIRTARTAMGKTSNSSVGEIHESPANERPALALLLRMNEQYAPISVCYMPTNGRFMNRPYKWSVGMLSAVRLARTPRLRVTVRNPFLI